jgi:hypothetical protein
MKELVISEKKLEVLEPIGRWNFLTLEDIREVSSYKGNINSLRKMLSRCEREGLSKGFISKFSGLKYYYLSKNAYHAIVGSNTYGIQEDIKHHDSVVSMIAYKLSKFPSVTSTLIKSQDIDLNKTIFSDGIDVDAIANLSIGGDYYVVALEIELTQKSRERIISKFDLYHRYQRYGTVIYFFSSKMLLRTYAKIYQDFMESHENNLGDDLIYFCHIPLQNRSFNLETLTIYSRNLEEFKMKEIF